MIFHKQLISTTNNRFQRDLKSQNALIQIKVFKQAVNVMGEKISDMDIEIEQNANKIQFSQGKMEIPDSKVIEEMIRLGLNKISCEAKE